MRIIISLLLMSAFVVNSLAQGKTSAFYELRIYYCHPGRLEALISRFENHTTRLFEKHGMENVGYWLPVMNDRNALYYILGYPDATSREKSWANFGSDPAWKEVQSKSEADGPIVQSVESIFLSPSDVQPLVKSPGGGAHLYELRTYTCLPSRLANLKTRFKDYTLKLFEKHGMANVMYFETVEKDEVQPKLVYLLAHQSEQNATKSWDAFRADPAWIAARDASEKDGKIIEKLETVYLNPLAFSKLK